MRGLQLILTEEDFILLTDYLTTAVIPEYNKRKLYSELKDARIVGKEHLPLNIVCRNAKVMIWNMDKNQTFSVQLVLDETLDGKNKISITDPIAVALLGYPSGAITEWEMPDGINRFKVISVKQADTDNVITY